MEEEFTRSLFNKIFYSALAAAPAIVFLIIYLNDTRQTPAFSLFLILLSLFAILVIASQVKNKIIISADHIVRVTLRGRKELLTANVKGVRIEQRYIVIEPVSSNYARIVINNYSDYADDADLTTWLRENFADLDASDLKQQQQKILGDPALGATELERKRKLTAAKIIAAIYSGLGMVLAFALITSYSRLGICLLLIYPLSGILIMALNPLIKFVSDSKRSVYPFILLGTLPPVFISFIKALGEYEIYNHQNIWPPFFGIALVVFFLIYKTGINDALPVKSQIIIILVVGLLYGYGSTIHINCDFDRSTPRLIQTTVYNKWIEHSKGTHYHLKLASWDSDPKPKDIEVSHNTFDKYSVNSPIDTYLRKGLLNIPWYSLYK